MTVIAVIFMTALYAGTLWSYLASWRGGALATSAVVFVLISLIFELVLLWRNAAKARWGIAITALMNLVLAIFCALQSDDPTGMSSVVCMVLLFPVTMYMALYDLVSDDTLLILAFVSYLILATVLVAVIRKAYPL